jgi:hypothetical protein
LHLLYTVYCILSFNSIVLSSRSLYFSCCYCTYDLQVGIKGQAPIIDGAFHKRIIVDDSYWTLDDDEIIFTLQKDNRMEWWKCVMQGDPEINTQKVQPENSKLADLDGETRQTVEKMM